MKNPENTQKSSRKPLKAAPSSARSHIKEGTSGTVGSCRLQQEELGQRLRKQSASKKENCSKLTSEANSWLLKKDLQQQSLGGCCWQIIYQSKWTVVKGCDNIFRCHPFLTTRSTNHMCSPGGMCSCQINTNNPQPGFLKGTHLSKSKNYLRVILKDWTKMADSKTMSTCKDFRNLANSQHPTFHTLNNHHPAAPELPTFFFPRATLCPAGSVGKPNGDDRQPKNKYHKEASKTKMSKNQ